MMESAWPNEVELRAMSTEELERLAARIRQTILETVSRTGGHLASSLGTVELTIALRRVFDFDPGPDADQLVWDVGHQSYAWKILTGRSERFATLRQIDGVSGFPKREESPYDAFNTGHSSTSISAAQGLQRAKLLRGEKGRIIAVIGDGAMTGGMAYEAMNNIRPDEPLIIILNDNQMSIEENVGTIAKHLDELRVHPQYLHIKANTEMRLNRIPGAGPWLVNKMEHWKAKMRYRIHRGGSLFEELGLRYYGPIDGHDLPLLEHYLKSIRGIHHPTLLHIVTEKGRGFEFAETDPQLYHGVAPFLVNKGVPEKENQRVLRLRRDEYFADALSYTEGFTWAIHSLAERDARLVAVCAAMRSGTGLADFAERYPERFYDVGIAEQHACTMAAGLAAGGMKPVLALYATFLQRALDQVFHDVCLQNLPVFFAVDRAGLVGEDGETHQGIYDLNFLLDLPKLEIWTASDPLRLANRMEVLYGAMDGPTMLRYSRGKSGLPETLRSKPEDPLPTSAETCRLWRFGAAEDETERQVVALSYGDYTGEVARAVEALVEKEPRCTVTLVDIERLKPLNLEPLRELLKRATGILVAEENSAPGPVAQAVEAFVVDEHLEVPLRRMALPLTPIAQGTRDEQLARYGLGPDDLAKALKELVGG